MGSKLVPSGGTNRLTNSPQGPGWIFYNVVEVTPAAILAIRNGDTSYGRSLGMLSAAPSFTVSQETVNIYSNAVGLNARLLGSEQLDNQEVSVECEFMELNYETLKLALPGLTSAVWNSQTNAFISVGTGNAAVKVVAVAGGTGGNSLQYAHAAPSGSVTTVAVSGTAPNYTITVTPKTGETAAGVVAAVNANATAKALVQAGLPSTSNGTGTVAVAAATALAGGTAGSAIGEKMTQPGFWTTADRLRNVCIVLESPKTDVAWVYKIKNAISMDDFSFSAEADQTLTGVGMAFTAENDEGDFDPAIGNYRPPFEIYKLTDVA